MPNKAPTTALAAAKIHAKKGSSQVQLAEIAAGTRTQKVDLQRESILARLRVARAQYSAAAAQVDAVIQALQGVGGARYDTSQPHEAEATTKQEERNPMSWHTILEDAAGVTVADVGHHPFTSAGLFFKALDGDFRIKIDGQNAGNLAPILSNSIDAMEEDPQEFKEFEGPLGSLDGARAYLVSLRMACLANPTATVRVIGDQAATTTAPAAD